MGAAFDERCCRIGSIDDCWSWDADTALVLASQGSPDVRAQRSAWDEVSEELQIRTLRARCSEQADSVAAAHVAALRDASVTGRMHWAEQLGQSWETHEAIGFSSTDLPGTACCAASSQCPSCL